MEIHKILIEGVNPVSSGEKGVPCHGVPYHVSEYFNFFINSKRQKHKYDRLGFEKNYSFMKTFFYGVDSQGFVITCTKTGDCPPNYEILSVNEFEKFLINQKNTMRFQIRFYSVDHYKAIQTRLFELGYSWNNRKQEIKEKPGSNKYISVGMDWANQITHTTSRRDKYEGHPVGLITLDDLYNEEKKYTLKKTAEDLKLDCGKTITVRHDDIIIPFDDHKQVKMEDIRELRDKVSRITRLENFGGTTNKYFEITTTLKVGCLEGVTLSDLDRTVALAETLDKI